MARGYLYIFAFSKKKVPGVSRDFRIVSIVEQYIGDLQSGHGEKLVLD